MGRCVVQYVLPNFTGQPIDRATIDGAIPDIRAHLAILNRALAKGPFFHGDKPQIDDFILLPMVDALFAVAPEGPGSWPRRRTSPATGRVPGAPKLRDHHPADVSRGGLTPGPHRVEARRLSAGPLNSRGKRPCGACPLLYKRLSNLFPPCPNAQT
jgi:hypothetical protein